MSLHPDFLTSPYAPLIPLQRWFPADEALRASSYDKLLLVDQDGFEKHVPKALQDLVLSFNDFKQS
jgi:hypothetical protein